MTLLNESRAAIYDAFIAAWGTASAFTFDNEDYDPPDGLPWARLTVRHQARQQVSLGQTTRRKFDSGGIVFVQCFAPLDGGTASADTLAELAQTIFEGKTLLPENIQFTNALIREIGPSDGWYQINVESFFTYTETK